MGDLLGEIWSSLKQNKLRTALTGFAVSWGLLIIIVLIGSGNGLMNALLSNMSGEVKNVITLYPGFTSKAYEGVQESTRVRFTDSDLRFIEQFSSHVERVTGNLSFSDTLALGNEKVSSSITAAGPEALTIDYLDLIHGRFINNKDQREKRRVIAIDNKLAEQLLGNKGDYRRIIGKDISVGDLSYKVVGILDSPQGSFYHNVYIPFETARQTRTDGRYLNNITIMFRGLETVKQNEDFENSLSRSFNLFHGYAPDDKSTLWINNAYTNEKEMNKAMKIIRTALWILGLLTLISGVVGVSNIMLITVKERIHEFGIRKALGASPWSILKLIVVESVLITAFFGYIGLIAGMGANMVLNNTIGAHPLDVGIAQIYIFKNIGVGMDVAIKATILLIVAGTLAGIIPAWKAARVRPIEALRAEK